MIYGGVNTAFKLKAVSKKGIFIILDYVRASHQDIRFYAEVRSSKTVAQCPYIPQEGSF